MVALVWFRQDLRLSDHLPLQAAQATGLPIIPLYIYEDHEKKTLGGASKWWLHHSLFSLKESLTMLGGDLVLKQGNAAVIILDLIERYSITHVFWQRRYDKEEREKDGLLKSELRRVGIVCQSFAGYLLSEPQDTVSHKGEPFKVFRGFQNKIPVFKYGQHPIEAPESLKFFPLGEELSDDLKSYDLLPHHPDWAEGLRKRWRPGEKMALQTFKHFINHDLKGYHVDRNYPGLDNTSHLSPHFRWGEISVRQVWHTVQRRLLTDTLNFAATEKFLTELKWRDFCHYTLFHYPDLPSQSQKSEWLRFPWQEDKGLLTAWQRGQVGYPIVDAGMRELYHTGYLPNRVRMIVSSFLVKDLLQPWQQGAEWFMDTLIDGDLAINSFNWQWVSSSSYECCPYFRVFNPILQGKKWDPEGHYIKKWIPALTRVPSSHVHNPWTLPPQKLKEIGLTLGIDYPYPIVDHTQAAAKVIALSKNLK